MKIKRSDMDQQCQCCAICDHGCGRAGDFWCDNGGKEIFITCDPRAVRCGDFEIKNRHEVEDGVEVSPQQDMDECYCSGCDTIDCWSEGWKYNKKHDVDDGYYLTIPNKYIIAISICLFILWLLLLILSVVST